MLDIIKKSINLIPKLNKTFQSSLYYLYLAAVSVFFLGDIFRKIAIHFECEFTRYSTVSKLVVLLIFLIFFISNFKTYIREDYFKKMAIAITILTVTFILGQISLRSNISQPLNFFLNIEYLVKYLYLPITILLFSSLKNEIEYVKKIICFIELIFLVNSIFILIGYSFEVNLFKTYGENRFGYIGVFSRSGQTSFFFIMFILFYYHRLMDKITKVDVFKLVFYISLSLLLGTKRIYFFLILLSLHYFVIHRGFKKRMTYWFIALAAFLAIFLKHRVIDAFNKVFDLFQQIYYNSGFISSLTSFRSDLFYNTINEFVLKNWSFTNYIFGGPSFQNYIFITGMDFFDLYLFFGLAGLFVYFNLFKILLDFKIQANFVLFFLFILMITSFFSSAFLYDPYVNFLFVLMIYHFSNYEKKQNPYQNKTHNKTK
jgi:hypothetical protein